MKRRNCLKLIFGATVGTFTGIACSAETEKGFEKMEKTGGKISGKVLVAYFSRSGNTRYVAETIARATGGTLFEIKAKKPYAANYNACCEEAKPECRAGTLREMAAGLPDLANYATVFIGSPNWWGTLAPPVRTFLSTSALAGKTVVPFFTHGGGGMQDCERAAVKLCAGAFTLKGRTFPGTSIRDSRESVTSWLVALPRK